MKKIQFILIDSEVIINVYAELVFACKGVAVECGVFILLVWALIVR